MSHSPFSHSHALNVAIPTSTAESIPQTPSERTGPQSDSFANPDVGRGPVRDSTVISIQRHGIDDNGAQNCAPLRTDTASHSHVLGISALDTVRNTPVQSGVEGVPSNPTSPRTSRRTTRTGSQFSAGEVHCDEGTGDETGDFTAEAAMMLGDVVHLVVGYVMHKELSPKDDHDGDEKDDA